MKLWVKLLNRYTHRPPHKVTFWKLLANQNIHQVLLALADRNTQKKQENHSLAFKAKTKRVGNFLPTLLNPLYNYVSCKWWARGDLNPHILTYIGF